MTALKNTRHEVFAKELAQGSSRAAAYAKAGYSPDRHHAARLATKGHVQQRITEIQAVAAELSQITVASLVAAADEIRRFAIRDKQHSAALAAVKEIGILTGLRIDRREVISPGEFDHMSDEELRQFLVSEIAMLIELPDDEPDEAR